MKKLCPLLGSWTFGNSKCFAIHAYYIWRLSCCTVLKFALVMDRGFQVFEVGFGSAPWRNNILSKLPKPWRLLKTIFHLLALGHIICFVFCLLQVCRRFSWNHYSAELDHRKFMISKAWVDSFKSKLTKSHGLFSKFFCPLCNCTCALVGVATFISTLHDLLFQMKTDQSHY